MEYKDKFNVNYSCGCVHEIGRNDVGMWMSTGNEKNCQAHSG